MTQQSEERMKGYFLKFSLKQTTCKIVPFLWRRAPQQQLRTHRSLKAYCATLVMKMNRKIIIFSLFQFMEHRLNETDRGKLKYSGENLSQCHFVHHEYHMD
jgi:hypothetical protein